MSQAFEVCEGDIINISFEARFPKNIIKNGDITFSFSYINDLGNSYDEQCYKFNLSKLTNNWEQFKLPIIANRNSRVMLKIYFNSKSFINIKNISCYKYVSPN